MRSNNPKIAYMDGAKGGVVDLWGDVGWTNLGSPLAWGKIDRFTLADRVGLLYRAVKIRSQSITEVPWEILKGDTVIWSSGDDFPPTELEWFENWPELLTLSEASLTLTSQAFWFLLRNRVRVTGVQWFSPLTVVPIWDKKLGLVRFDRYVDNEPIPIKLEDMVYIWYRSSLKETAPETSPLEAAERNAKTIDNMDLFISTFFERGAIKATLLTVEGNPVQAEKDKLKLWWESALTGIKKAFSTEVLSATVKPIVVGEGMKDLSNTKLSQEKREDMVATLGVPLSKIFSNAANYATANQDDIAFYKNTIIPDCRLIASIANKTLRDLGYVLRFTPETMDIFQEDETGRADSYAKYVGSGMKPSIAAAILGIELPEGIEYEDLDPEEKEEETPPDEDTVPQEDELDSAQMEELDKFKRKSLKRLASGKGAYCEFDSRLLPTHLLTELGTQLTDAATKEDVDRIFDPTFVKALILRLDRDDDDAERAARMSIENESVRNISSALNKFQDGMFSGGEPKDAETEKQRIIREFTADPAIRDAMSRMLQDSVDEGIKTSVKQFNTIGLGFDWNVPNTAARLWAEAYTDTLLQQLGNTTGNGVGAAIGRWVSNGEPLSSLVKDLTPLFGKERARLIAATEVTRAYTQGTLAGWKAAGYGDGEPTEVSPKHPGCRCILVLKFNNDGSADYLWYTAVDERVCPQCGALHNKTVGRARNAN